MRHDAEVLAVGFPDRHVGAQPRGEDGRIRAFLHGSAEERALEVVVERKVRNVAREAENAELVSAIERHGPEVRIGAVAADRLFALGVGSADRECDARRGAEGQLAVKPERAALDGAGIAVRAVKRRCFILRIEDVRPGAEARRGREAAALDRARHFARRVVGGVVEARGDRNRRRFLHGLRTGRRKGALFAEEACQGRLADGADELQELFGLR